MGRFNASDADNYGSTGEGTSFFSLKNDGDTARVRFMYNGMNDVEGYAVHEVTIGDKRRYVNCLRNYNEPVDKCPFCAARSQQLAKLYIPLYDVDEKSVKIWERGKKFFGTIQSICARYSDTNTPLVSTIFEIERHGKPHSTDTTYMPYKVDTDNTRLEDLPEIPQIIGKIVMDKSADDMTYYIENGDFPTDTINRGSSSRNDDYDDRAISRRTPPATGRRSDAF